MKKKMSMFNQGRPDIQVIVLPADISDDEIQRNLEKKDCDYSIVDDEMQIIAAEFGKAKVRKTVLWSDKKQKFKVFVFQ